MAVKFTDEPDRIYVTKDVIRIIEQLDTSNYLGLSKQDATRSDLFLFAMALGVETQSSEELANSIGLTLSKSLTAETKAIFFASYINEISGEENLDEIGNQEAVFKRAQEYANAGFHIIEGYQNTTKDNVLCWKLMEELDKQYENLVSNGKI